MNLLFNFLPVVSRLGNLLVILGNLFLYFNTDNKMSGFFCRFRPCIIIYLASVVPNIWVLEYDLMENRLSEVRDVNGMNVTVCLTGDDTGMQVARVLEELLNFPALNFTITDNMRICTQ